MAFRNLILLLALVTFLAACGQSTTTPQPTPQPGEVTLKDVAFQADTGKQATGNVKLVQVGDKYALQLSDNFSVSAGTDLHVWLLKSETDVASHLSIAKLSSNTGAQRFDIPAGTDLSSYKVIFIWCESASELFAKAFLDPAPAPNPTPTPNPTPNPTPQTIFTGTFDTAKDSRGTLEIVQTGTARVLKLSSNFDANGTNNVDLWLAKDASGKDYIELPNLKTTGAQTFDIAASVDFAVYKYVVVWCADVSVVIGTAELMTAK